jgi:hypothetical protein
MNYKLLILGIILGVVLSGLIYWFYSYVNKKSDPNDTSSTVGATKNYLLDGGLTIPIKRFKLKNWNAHRFCVELWLFINPDAIINPGDLEIFKISGDKMKLILKSTTELIVKINNIEYEITPSFFLQKWQQVIISIDQHLVDLYLDGKLMSSNVSRDRIQIPNDDDNISFSSIENKSDYYVSGLNIKTTAMDTKTALKHYNEGKSKVNGSTKVSLALTKNENIAKNFMLF